MSIIGCTKVCEYNRLIKMYIIYDIYCYILMWLAGIPEAYIIILWVTGSGWIDIKYASRASPASWVNEWVPWARLSRLWGRRHFLDLDLTDVDWTFAGAASWRWCCFTCSTGVIINFILLIDSYTTDVTQDLTQHFIYSTFSTMLHDVGSVYAFFWTVFSLWISQNLTRIHPSLFLKRNAGIMHEKLFKLRNFFNPIGWDAWYFRTSVKNSVFHALYLCIVSRRSKDVFYC